MSEHAPEPLPGTAYTIGGPCDNHRFDERLVRAYPATAHCTCGEMLHRVLGGEWEHAGRMPGELG